MKTRFPFLLGATLVHLTCGASATVPFPPIEEGEWTIGVNAVFANGEKTAVPEKPAGCMHPIRNMQKELGKLEEKGCRVHMGAGTSELVRYAIACPTASGEQRMDISLTVPDSRSFRQVIKSEQGSSELTGRWVGQCQSRTDEPR
ncbi:hypothetical protein G4G28_09910 [Massilia sp. Dwa41.01b]|uniref:hypothetical protein n=1 Tax=unclassified Massilia TaxID=2609279 RepID=UPI001601E698|nr:MULTISPECIES: hypothetical protein [unclassified Massilia]QNA88732.1 hypothetical protein G4G28_09910 [Massilia sp. Dwa41.01b]QNA99630.1 hypothetical protein G4G31_13580 [Massilia sp. Se16.2.3]